MICFKYKNSHSFKIIVKVEGTTKLQNKAKKKKVNE